MQRANDTASLSVFHIEAMSGKRLLDAALLFNATRKIAREHVRIRLEQFDVWSKTSTVATTVKNQTDRVTLTAQAAAVLARRLNEEAPAWTKSSVQTKRADSSDPVPSSDSVDTPPAQGQRGGVLQDHHYERSQKNAAQEPTPESEINVQQKKPARYPTPDGTIPPNHAPVDVPAGAELVEAAGQRVSAPPAKEPLVSEQEQRAGSISPESSGASTIPDPRGGAPDGIPSAEAVPEQEQIPEGVNTDVFHSPRVSKLLGKKKQEEQQQEGQDARATRASMVSDTRTDAPNNRQDSATEIGNAQMESTSEEDVKDLASSIVTDTDSTSQVPQEVGLFLT